MNEPEIKMNVPAESDPGDLRQQMVALEKTLQLALLIVLIISGCFMLYLWRQQRGLIQQVKETRPIGMDLDTNINPFITNFVPRLLEYAKNHPDLNPILDKYNLRQTALQQAATIAPAASAPSKPVAPTPPKK